MLTGVSLRLLSSKPCLKTGGPSPYGRTRTRPGGMCRKGLSESSKRCVKSSAHASEHQCVGHSPEILTQQCFWNPHKHSNISGAAVITITKHRVPSGRSRNIRSRVQDAIVGAL